MRPLAKCNEARIEYDILLFTPIYIYRGSWIAKPFDKNPWIQGAFDKEIKITAIQTQGRHDYWNWVKTYKISYSKTGADWEVYKNEDGSEHVISPMFIIFTTYLHILCLMILTIGCSSIEQLFYYFQIFQGNTDHTTVVTNTLHQPIDNVKYLRILPLTWAGIPSLRFEILGCDTKGIVHLNTISRLWLFYKNCFLPFMSK